MKKTSIGLTLISLLVATTSHAATTAFDWSASPANLANGNASYNFANHDETQADVVHHVQFYADSTMLVVDQTYLVYESGGTGTGFSIFYTPKAIGPHPAGPGNWITDAQLEFYSGAGNNNPVTLDLNYAFSSANIDVVAAFNRDAGVTDYSGSGVTTDYAANETLTLIANTSRAFTSGQTAIATGTDSGNDWNGGGRTGVGAIGDNAQGYTAGADIGFPAVNFHTSYGNDDTTGASDTQATEATIDFAGFLDPTDASFAFGLINYAAPEPSRAVLLLLGLGTLLLQRRRS